MSEREQKEDELMLHIGDDREFLMTRHNATLFTFAGSLATRNHVFLVTGEQRDGIIEGTYVFSFAETYNPLMSFILTHNYPMHLNLNEVAECDETAFQRGLDQMSGGEDIEDFLPDDWLNDEK